MWFYGESIVDRSTVSHRGNRFHGDSISINDNPSSGRPKITTNGRSVGLVANAPEDRRAASKELSESTGIPPTSVVRILKNYLDIATLLRQRFDVQGQTFLCRIIAIDKHALKSSKRS